jgi:hypothetical protein
MSLEVVPALNEILAQLPVVINLAIENQRHISSLIEEGLIARLKINDAQATNGQGEVGQLKLAVAVWAAVDESRRHKIDALALGRRFERQIEDAADSAHSGVD